MRNVCKNLESVAPDDLSLVMPFLKLPSLMQVGDLKQYLNTKFRFDENFFNLLEVLVKFEGKVSSFKSVVCIDAPKTSIFLRSMSFWMKF